MRGIAQALMGLVKPLALLLRELLWPTSGFHVSPSAGPWWSTVTVAHDMGSSLGGLAGRVVPLISALSAQEAIESLELRVDHATQPDHHDHDQATKYDQHGRGYRKHNDDLGIAHEPILSTGHHVRFSATRLRMPRNSASVSQHQMPHATEVAHDSILPCIRVIVVLASRRSQLRRAGVRLGRVWGVW
jgi:hypothetical protein